MYAKRLGENQVENLQVVVGKQAVGRLSRRSEVRNNLI